MLFLIIAVLTLSCSTTYYETLDFGKFKITVPDNWQKYEMQGLDSYVGGIVTDKGDTLIFDLGWYSGDISEDLPMVYDADRLSELTRKERELLPKTKHLIVDDLFPTDVDMRDYLKYKWELDTIDGFPAKVITPTNSGFGGSGIYIDSLSSGNSNKGKFSFYGFHLTDKTQADFLKALKTLQFE